MPGRPDDVRSQGHSGPHGCVRRLPSLTQRGNAVLFAKLRNGCFRNTNAIDEADVARPSLKDHRYRSRYCGRSEFGFVFIPLVAANEGDLNENYRARCGHSRKDVFAGAFMPELVHGQAQTNEYKTPDI
jgi:hypothetical protein